MGSSKHVAFWITLTVLLFDSQGTVEEKASINVQAGKSVDVFVLYTNTPPPDGDDENGEGRLSQPALMRGVVCTIPF